MSKLIGMYNSNVDSIPNIEIKPTDLDFLGSVVEDNLPIDFITGWMILFVKEIEK